MIPIAELRALVGLAEGDESADDLLISLEAYGVAQVELTTGAYLGPSVEATNRIIGNGSDRLRLPRWPVSAVALIEQSYVTDVVPVPVAITEFVIRSPYLIRTGGARWDLGAEFAITYTAGYAANAYPPVYRQAVKDIVGSLYPAATSAASGGIAAGELTKETFGEYSYGLSEGSSTGSDAAHESVDAILARLPRRVRV